ncbi:hypothetical protein D3C78_1268300 [compost metagenome]
MAHVGQESRPGLRHIQGLAPCLFKLLVGLAQAGIAGLELEGARRDNVFQLVEIVGQAILGIASLLDFSAHADELLIGHFDQYANLIVFVARRKRQFRLCGVAGITLGQGADHPHQRLGQHEVEQGKEDAGQDQAAYEAIEQGDFGPFEKAIAEGKCINLQVQGTQVLVWHVAEEQGVLELSAFTEQKVTDKAVAAFLAWSMDVGQYGFIVVDQPGPGDRWRLQQSARQLLGKFGIYVVGNA